MKVFCIKNEKGQLISAWPKLGVAKIHCRTELKDYIRVGHLNDFCPAKSAKGRDESAPPGFKSVRGCVKPKRKAVKRG